ncbi:hypothetical protein BGZ65_009055 [Modicella reniformis]|uniref:Uncharacterized protein n=1 Tax=Modicella reniformis TaxID=1440133 RepID=A0A9P6LS23_9FUNG|nr:hypothetical protein BGZ65_009055 [Modicella reniformis]
MPAAAENNSKKPCFGLLPSGTKHAELEAAERAAQVHDNVLEKSTSDHYLRYERRWIAFCDRHNYGPYNVTQSATTRYSMELTAEKSEPEKDIFPLLVRRRKSKSKTNAG